MSRVDWGRVLGAFIVPFGAAFSAVYAQGGSLRVSASAALVAGVSGLAALFIPVPKVTRE